MQPPPAQCILRYIPTDSDLPYEEVSRPKDSDQSGESGVDKYVHDESRGNGGNKPEAQSVQWELGRGFHGQVIVVRKRNDPTGDLLARKQYLGPTISSDPFRKPVALAALLEELKILNALDKDNPTNHRVKVRDAFTVGMKDFFLIIEPVALQGTLADMLNNFAFAWKTKTRKDFQILRRVSGCLTAAVASLHTEGYRHRDLHPGNILLQFGKPLLCDFGASLHVECDARGTTRTYFPPRMERYAAPEVLSTIQDRNNKADVFALGVILFEIELAIDEYRTLARTLEDGEWRWSSNLEVVEAWCKRLIKKSQTFEILSYVVLKDPLKRFSAQTVAAIMQDNTFDYTGPRPMMCAACHKWVWRHGDTVELEKFKKARYIKLENKRQECFKLMGNILRPLFLGSDHPWKADTRLDPASPPINKHSMEIYRAPLRLSTDADYPDSFSDNSSNNSVD